jgi:hypothetical protein
MTDVMALRNSVLCGIAVVAVAGCGAVRASSTVRPAVPGATTPPAVSVVAPTAAPTATTPVTPDTSGINQQISGIDNQLSTIDGQLNAANAGLSTSEGDPSQ